MEVFGIKDTLKPLDVFISDINTWKQRFEEDEENPTMLKLQITGVKWTNEATLTNDLPNILDIEVDADCFESAKAEGNLSDFLKSEISEDFVFTPTKIRRYKIL